MIDANNMYKESTWGPNSQPNYQKVGNKGVQKFQRKYDTKRKADPIADHCKRMSGGGKGG